MKKIIAFSFFTLFAIIICCYANAQNQFSKYKTVKEIDAALQKCYDKAENNSVSIDCSYQASAAADKILNQLYKKALNKSPVTFKSKLIGSQRQWLLYKNNDDKLQKDLYVVSPGTMWIATIGDRAFEIIKERCEYLQTLIDRFDL